MGRVYISLTQKKRFYFGSFKQSCPDCLSCMPLSALSHLETNWNLKVNP